jgi:hypothetical protein
MSRNPATFGRKRAGCNIEFAGIVRIDLRLGSDAGNANTLITLWSDGPVGVASV